MIELLTGTQTFANTQLAQIYGVDQIGDTCFLVLELVEGEGLDERIARGPMAAAEVLWGQAWSEPNDFSLSGPYIGLNVDLGYFGAFIGIETADEWENATPRRPAFRILPRGAGA